MSDAPRRRLNWHKLHSFFGLSVSLFLAFLFLTGTLLVFSVEIDKALNPKSQVEPLPGGKLGWGQIYDVATAARPGWPTVRLIRDDDDTAADQVVMLNPDAPGDRYIWVDPYRGQVLGESTERSFQGIMLQLHERLFINGTKGKLVITVFALPLTAAVIAGLFTYRRFWTGFFRMPRRSGSARAFLSDLHRLIAVWSLIFFIPLILTSLWYFAEVVGLGVNVEVEHPTENRQTLLPDDFDGARLDAAMRLADEVLPGLRVSAVALPRFKPQPIVVQGQLTAILVIDQANTVHIHPETFEVLGVHRGEDLSLHQRISAGADFIHFGTWGGLTSKVIWTVFGIALTALAVIGIVINAKRLGAMEAKRPTGPARSGLVRTWRAMGPYGLGAWLSAGLILWGLTQLVYKVFLT